MILIEMQSFQEKAAFFIIFSINIGSKKAKTLLFIGIIFRKQKAFALQWRTLTHSKMFIQ